MGKTRATEVDVLVVGAGPGGAAAAYHLARHGVSTLVVDRAAFPREKVCGDGLTPRGVKAMLGMGIDPDDPGFARVRGLRVYGRHVTLELPWPHLSDYPDYGLVRTRHDFDDLLVKQAVKAGATLWERSEATAPILDRGWVAGAVVSRDGQGDGEPVEVRARFVLAADGAASRFAGRAGVERDPARPLGIAARRYYRSERPLQPWLEAWLDLWEGDSLLPGYGWVFPVTGGLVNVGAGLLNTFRNFKDVSARHVFDIFLRMLPEDWRIDPEHEAGPILSGPLPMGFNRRPLAVPGLLVVGDAGGVVNPFNGEGIAYAIETAEIAAELVFEALSRGRPGLAHVYPTVLRERYGRYYWIGRKFVQAIGNPAVMRAATRYGLPRAWVMRFALRFMANLTDGRDGDAQDRLMAALVRLAPAS
ncbi:MAG: geranylgeranyl reductase family protein [Actinobacteria bacterium]|nr:geranylgeranyl reductase family protein [Actinomycetota bacterium]